MSVRSHVSLSHSRVYLLHAFNIRSQLHAQYFNATVRVFTIQVPTFGTAFVMWNVQFVIPEQKVRIKSEGCAVWYQLDVLRYAVHKKQTINIQCKKKYKARSSSRLLVVDYST